MTRDGSLLSVKSSPFAVRTRTPRLIRARMPSSWVISSRAKRLTGDDRRDVNQATFLHGPIHRLVRNPIRPFSGLLLKRLDVEIMHQSCEGGHLHEVQPLRLGPLGGPDFRQLRQCLGFSNLGHRHVTGTQGQLHDGPNTSLRLKTRIVHAALEDEHQAIVVENAKDISRCPHPEIPVRRICVEIDVSHSIAHARCVPVLCTGQRLKLPANERFQPLGLGVVPRKGLEPSRPLSHWHLKPARLPIPPPGHAGWGTEAVTTVR